MSPTALAFMSWETQLILPFRLGILLDISVDRQKKDTVKTNKQTTTVFFSPKLKAPQVIQATLIF